MERKISALFQSQNGNGMIGKKKLRAAAYCRVSSSSEEQLSSYQNQVSYYKRFLEDNSDYEFVGVYADEGISGTALRKREAFLRMMEDCKSRKIDVIYTKSVSRFGRNTVDALESIRALKEYNVNVIFEKEHIESQKVEGELLLTVLMALSQNESKQQSDNVKWGIRRRYERGEIQSIPLGTLQGYDKNEDGNLVINEKEAEIIRHIYELYLKDMGTIGSVRFLKKKGFLQTWIIQNGHGVRLRKYCEMRSTEGICFVKKHITRII